MSAEAGRSEAVEDPVAYFVEDMAFHGKSERTVEAYGRVLRQFEEFLAEGGRDGGERVAIAEATHRDCTAWLHQIRASRSESTVATYASYLHRFYSYMVKTEVFDDNPMALVLEEMNETIESDPSRRQISIPEMREFVGGIDHPLERAVIVTLLKTGMRAGELCNLDRRDLHLGTVPLEHTASVSPRVQLEGRPNSLYVSAEPAEGNVQNGEKRTVSNKRKRSTVVPVDAELQDELVRWLAIRPDTPSPAEPLFASTTRWGKRLTPNVVHRIVTDHAAEVGWYREGAGIEENVTPHYFRHFFTTHLRDRTGDRGVVKYLRGDVADDVIDTYTHNWGDRVREVYEANMYSLL